MDKIRIDATLPNDAKPDDAKPDDTKPATTKPDVTKPDVTDGPPEGGRFWEVPRHPSNLLDALKREHHVRTWGLISSCKRYLGSVAKCWEEKDTIAFGDRAKGAAHRGHALYHSVCQDASYLLQLEDYIASKEAEAADDEEDSLDVAAKN